MHCVSQLKTLMFSRLQVSFQNTFKALAGLWGDIFLKGITSAQYWVKLTWDYNECHGITTKKQKRGIKKIIMELFKLKDVISH